MNVRTNHIVRVSVIVITIAIIMTVARQGFAWTNPTSAPPFATPAISIVDGDVGIGIVTPDTNYRITTSGGGVKAESATAQPAGYFNNTGGGPAISVGTGGLTLGGVNQTSWPTTTDPTKVAKTGDTMSGSLSFSNVGIGPIGTYDPTKTQAVWSMGPAYVLPAGGGTSNYGALYGLGWSYEPDYAGAGNNPQSKAGLSHQLLIMHSGVTKTAIGNGIWTSGPISTQGYTFQGPTTTYGTLSLVNQRNGYYGLLFGQSTANPNLMFDGSGNGGFYYENYGWATYMNGSTHNLGIGTTDTSYKLNVGGSINGTSLCISGTCYSSWPAGGGQWTTSGSNIYSANSGSVGIGTTEPSEKLDVNGNIKATISGVSMKLTLKNSGEDTRAGWDTNAPADTCNGDGYNYFGCSVSDHKACNDRRYNCTAQDGATGECISGYYVTEAVKCTAIAIFQGI